MVSSASAQQITFSMAIENMGVVHDCFHKHSCTGTARMKEDKEANEEGKETGLSKTRGKAARKKKEVPTKQSSDELPTNLSV